MLFSQLKRHQKEAIALLQSGTFLEYFDLMIYVHMAVVLNELFFPPTDPKTASILMAFAFCSTYVLRPFGALIFGYIGDHWGRRPTVIITTTMMAFCCMIMANLPTYSEIGIKAAVIVSVLRILQGLSSMGERMGAQIYITEITRPPIQYPLTSMICVAGSLGGFCALGVSTLATQVGFNWRLAFWLGAIIAVVGLVARTRLRETPDYVDANRKMKRAIERAAEEGLEKPGKILKSTNKAIGEVVCRKTFFCYLSAFIQWPFAFYIAYIFFIPILKSNFSYSTSDVIFHNFLLSIFHLIAATISAFISYKVYPLFAFKITSIIFTSLMVFYSVFWGFYEMTPIAIFVLQSCALIFSVNSPALSIFIGHFPVFKRFTAVTFGYALARAIMYIIISFGLFFLTEWFGFSGVLFIAFPILFLWLFSLNHFEKLEKESGDFPKSYPWNLPKGRRKRSPMTDAQIAGGK